LNAGLYIFPISFVSRITLQCSKICVLVFSFLGTYHEEDTSYAWDGLLHQRVQICLTGYRKYQRSKSFNKVLLMKPIIRWRYDVTWLFQLSCPKYYSWHLKFSLSCILSKRSIFSRIHSPHEGWEVNLWKGWEVITKDDKKRFHHYGRSW